MAVVCNNGVLPHNHNNCGIADKIIGICSKYENTRSQ